MKTQRIVEVPDGEIVLSLNPLMNLLIHTLSLYELLGGHGQKYLLKNDPESRNAIDQEIFDCISGKERYFGRGHLDIYKSTITSLVSSDHFSKYPTDQILNHISPSPFNLALIKSWNEFYEQYWNREFPRLSKEFELMSTNLYLADTLSRMEELAGRKWSGRLLIFAVEATAESGLTCSSNICIGTVNRNRDAGFVHEGFHLLLDGKWADYPEIKNHMNGKQFSDNFWSDWRKKFEQALVVSLDCHVRKLNQDTEFVRRYFKGCRVSDLFEIAWPMVSDYVYAKDGKLEDLMLNMILESEKQNQR